jgi:hypothetical protein
MGRLHSGDVLGQMYICSGQQRPVLSLNINAGSDYEQEDHDERRRSQLTSTDLEEKAGGRESET